MSTLQFESMLALDSCSVIGALQSPKIARMISRLFWGTHSRIVLQYVVLNEAERILHLPKEKIMIQLRRLLKKEIFVFATTDEMKTEAKKYEKQYWICHTPDSIILAAAKMNCWTLVTIDRNLLQTANFEGVLALNPYRIGGH